VNVRRAISCLLIATLGLAICDTSFAAGLFSRKKPASESIVDPEPAPTTSRSSTTVVIDAGHGGFDRGGIPRQQVSEKDMTLDVALRLRSLLQKSGYKVVMTRDRDVFIPLGTRVAIANSYRNAIFVCIHFNSATRAGANGIETYFYSRDSLALASAIHYNLIGNTPTPNRGVRRRGYFVLRKTRIPAVLVECGFLTNPNEARNTLSGSYRQGLAENIARGIGNRNAVAGRSSGGQLVAATGAIPLQPFIDQTRVHDPDLSRKKRSSTKKRSKHKSVSSKHSSEIASSKKRASKPED
jgi:N-acetylmuramoyl-L-alanine amidase